ncbi:BamA/TamA family outer membrane protein [candidate division KSB1 bacterium]|nr:BamA/TamA family outer membrane protein [candidate division KSB1 bacterium]
MQRLLILILFLLSGVILYAQEGYTIKSLKFSGNTTFSDGRLKEQIATNSQSFLNKVLFWKDPPTFSEAEFSRDIEFLTRFYQRQGFLFVEIDSQVVADHDEQVVNLEVTIQENTPIRVDSLSFSFSHVDHFNKEHFNRVREKNELDLTLRPGERFRDQAFMNDRETIAQIFTENGYPTVKVNSEPALNPQKHSIDLKYVIDTGERCLYGELIVRGNDWTPKKSIVKQLTFERGDIFRQSDLEDSQRQIFQLGLFEYVSVRALVDQIEGQYIPIEIQIKQAPRITSRLGVGYGREEEFRTFVKMELLGMLGRDRRINLSVRHSQLEPINASAQWIKPAFLFPRAQITVNPFYRKEREPGFSVQRVGASVLYQQNFRKFTYGFVQYTLEQDQLDVSTLTRQEALSNYQKSLYNKSSLRLSLTRDSSQPLFSPQTGSYRALTLALSGLGFESDFHYASYLFEWRRYHPVFDETVFAWRIKIGSMWAILGDQVTPIEERFFTGGSQSNRGWARSRLGPQNSAGRPVGGNSLLETSIEFRIPVWNKFSVVVFTDAGKVWRPSMTWNLSESGIAVGGGLRYSTPIGPIRLDVGYPVSEGDYTPQFHISVGQAF